MSYNKDLVQGIRENLMEYSGIEEKRMFGGVGFLINGKMACGVLKESIVVRIGPEKYNDGLSKPGAREFDFTGKPMKGWIMVDPDGYEAKGNLKRWTEQGVDYALSLPSKK